MVHVGWRTATLHCVLPRAAVLLVAALLLAGVGRVSAEEPKDPPPAADDPAIFGPEDRVDPLPEGLLSRVSDSRPLPVIPADFNPKDTARQKLLERELGEVQAYLAALLNANRFSSKAFANSALRGITYSHLMEEPKKQRGTVVHVEGLLKRVRRYDPPLMATQAGVRDQYEGWLFEKYPQDKDASVNPVCLVFTELPEGLSADERLDATVKFDGYFFKRYRYQNSGKEMAEVPLVIGHGPVLVSVAADTPPASDWNGAILNIFLGGVAGVVLLVGAIHLWFRRADRKVHARVAGAFRKEFVPPPAEEVPGAAAGGDVAP